MPRCLLVSNRLPVSFHSKLNTFQPSSGGLVSAIKGLDEKKIGFNFEWMGIITDDIDPRHIESLNKSYHPIIVPKVKYDQYYNLYCNNVLWPLFHYERSMVIHNQEGWDAYCEVNKHIAEAILREAKDDDIVWIHDFHLLLVPGLIKSIKPHFKIGFFLHIPFPSSEIFRELPQRTEILESMIQIDLLGFHDLTYLNHFRNSVQRILGDVPVEGKMWGVYPISINTEYFIELTQHHQTKHFISKYKKNKQHIKWILGVDRLDYIKGLLLKLRAFRSFLKKHPEEREKVQLIQIVIPSRTEVPVYKQLKEEIEQLVSQINGEFGSPTWMPIQYLYHSVSEYELSALYQLSEILFVTSRRDGMNLVSLEYVVSQTNEYPGIVLLSEFAGSHSTLSYAMTINPWDIQDTANRIKEALHHPDHKRRIEMKSMKDFLKQYTSSDWARIILRDLVKGNLAREEVIPVISNGTFSWMGKLKGKRILFFCDLDGTLAPIASHPHDIKLTDKTISLLHQISKNRNCDFVIISGRDKEFLEEQFIDHDLKFPIGACHGAYLYSPDDQKWHNLIPQDSIKWKESIIEILSLYTTRTPHSFIEDKGHALTWHYRNSPKDFSDFLSSKLFFELESALSGQPVQVIRGKKIIEIRSIHANKGHFVQSWIQGHNRPDMIVAIGDDTSDEDMFNILHQQNDIEPFCIKVGREKTGALYSIREQYFVNHFLQNFLTTISTP